MAWRLKLPLVTVACHDDLSANDLTGRYLVRGGETVWQDGPLTTAVRAGAVCYLDEIVEARQDTVVAIHPLTDDRRLLPLEKTGELLHAHSDFHLVVSYNPGYQNMIKDLKPSTRQRFVTIAFDFPPRDREIEIICREAGVERPIAASLVKLAERIRHLRDRGLVEVASTRLLVHAGSLIASGVEPRHACESAIAGPLSDDPDLLAVILELVAVALPS
jgi:nitric oxide reductase NorQ protein